MKPLLFRTRRGFTLVELILAGALSMIVFSALLSVQQHVLVQRQRHSRAQKFSADAAYAVDCIKQSLRSASVVTEPEPAGGTGRLSGYENVNPLDLSSPLTAASPQKYFLYCFDPAAGALYKYSGAYPPAATFTAFYCGKPPGDSQERDTVINGFENAQVTYEFLRDTRNTNVLTLRYSFRYDADHIRGSTAFAIQKSL